MAGQVGGSPMLSRHEERRIAWFGQSWDECVGPEPIKGASPVVIAPPG